MVVSDREDVVAVNHKLPPPREPHWICPTGTVEGQGDRSAPLYDHRVTHFVFDMASAYVPRVPAGGVGAPETERPGCLCQGFRPAGERPIEVWVRTGHLGRKSFCPRPHPRQVLVGSIDHSLFGIQVRLAVVCV